VCITVASGLLVFGAALPARAQATAQIPLQFNFLDPGARSLAMGSAFTAVADDATAAFTNPAGLTFLVKPEISAEIRYQRLATPFLSAGRISGTVTNQGVDTINGPVYTDSLDAATRPYFFSSSTRGSAPRLPSIVTNWFIRRTRSRLTVFSTRRSLAGFRQRQQNVSAGRSRSIAIDNYGGSVAFRFADAFSAGVGVAVYNFSLASSFAQHGLVGGNAVGAVDPNQTYATATQSGSGTKAAVNAGAIWTASQQVRFGAVSARARASTLPRSIPCRRSRR
jgi:Long-chain fatty acid transport protein